MAEIILHGGIVTRIDDEDFESMRSIHLPNGGVFSARICDVGWYCRSYGGSQYVWSSLRNSVALHRFIMEAPRGVFVDHVSGDTLDNRRCNLRLANRSENRQNSKPHNGSATKGVWRTKNGKPFAAALRIGGRCIYLGRNETRRLAQAAYNRAAIKHFGQFARIVDLETIS